MAQNIQAKRTLMTAVITHTIYNSGHTDGGICLENTLPLWAISPSWSLFVGVIFYTYTVAFSIQELSFYKLE